MGSGKNPLDKSIFGIILKTVKTKEVFIVSGRADAEDGAVRGRIIAAARELFLKNGFIRVTSDDISASLGISKATLYKYFSSKEELLRLAMETLMQSILGGVEAVIQDEEMDFVTKLIKLMTYLGGQISRIGTVLAQDMQRSTPEVWREIDRFRREKILKNFKALFSAGIKEGVFKKDINRDLLVLMFVALIQDFINPEMLMQYSYRASDIFETIIKIFFEGILTDKARKKYQERKPVSFGPGKEELA
jgi:AcrR family transcriptional regulator